MKNKLVKGFQVKFETLGDRIAVGGTSYALPPNIGLGAATIFFDGVDFKICQNGNDPLSLPDAIDLTANHIFESAFPNGDLVANVPIPRKPDLNSTPSTGIPSKVVSSNSSEENTDEEYLRKHEK